jgi:hypothetical protein
LGPNAAALLIETRAPNFEHLQEHINQIIKTIEHIPTINGNAFLYFSHK